jgi:hypothetical protein
MCKRWGIFHVWITLPSNCCGSIRFALNGFPSLIVDISSIPALPNSLENPEFADGLVPEVVGRSLAAAPGNVSVIWFPFETTEPLIALA